MISQRKNSVLLVVGLAWLCFLCGCAREAPAGRYDAQGNLTGPQAATANEFNVVLISIDTLRPDHLGCYGYERNTSPNIDRLASESVLFENTDSCSPWTTPSHISLMTSLYPSVHKVYPYPNPGTLDANAVTLAEILQAQGFETGGFTEGGYAQGKIGLDHGFSTFPGWPEDEGTYVSHEFAPSRLEEGAQRALAWLDEHGDRQFFLFFHTYEPHFPYRPPAEYIQRINPEWSAERETEQLRAVLAKLDNGVEPSAEDRGVVYRHHLQGDLTQLPANDVRRLRRLLAKFYPTAWSESPGFRADLDYVIDLYDAEILYSDSVVGRILDKLRSLGVYDETIVVLVSDHGEGLMDHGVIDHGWNLYQELLHVPLIVRLPGNPAAGSSVSAPNRLIDVMPTVLDALGLPALPAAQGQTLLPLIKTPAADDAGLGSLGEALTIRDREMSLGSLRRGQWKYIRHDKDGREELYDLRADPAEKDNLVAQQPSVVGEMRITWEVMGETNREAGSTMTSSAMEMSDAERKRLESLGYLGGGSSTEQQQDSGPLLDPAARAALVRALSSASKGTPVWLTASQLDSGSQALLDQLRQAFLEAGWTVEGADTVPFPIRPGVLLLAADATAPEYVNTVHRALVAAGLGTKLMTGYREYFEEQSRVRTDFKGFEMDPGQTYVVVLGRTE